MELSCLSGTVFSNFLKIEALRSYRLFLRKVSLLFLHKATILLTKFCLKMVSRPVFQFAQFWNRFGCSFYNTGDLYRISLFLGYCIFTFLDNKGIPLPLFTSRKSFFAVLAERNDSLGTIWFDNDFFYGVLICTVLKYIWLGLPQYKRFVWN